MNAHVHASTATRTYGAHGEWVGSGHAAYTGQVREPGTGGYLLGTRMYSPVLRRFLNPDTAGPFGDGGVQRYAYCNGDPFNRIDPDGHAWMDWLLAGIGIVGAVMGTIASGGALLGVLGAAAAGSLTAAVSTPAMVGMTAVAALDAVSLAADVGWVGAMAAGDERATALFGIVGMGTGFASMGAGSLGGIAGAAGKSTAAASARRGLAELKPGNYVRATGTSVARDRPVRRLAPPPRRHPVAPRPSGLRPASNRGIATARPAARPPVASDDLPMVARTMPPRRGIRAEGRGAALGLGQAWSLFVDAYDDQVTAWMRARRAADVSPPRSAATSSPSTPRAEVEVTIAAGLALAYSQGAVDDQVMQDHQVAAERAGAI